MNADNISISDDKSKLDINLIHNFLTNSYWAKGRTIDEVKTSIENSDCYGLYIDDYQVGFARIITDFVVFAYLLDVFIIPEFQGRGFSKLLLTKIFEDKKFKNVKKWMLSTADAHSLYEKLGFKKISTSNKLMEMIPHSQLIQTKNN